MCYLSFRVVILFHIRAKGRIAGVIHTCNDVRVAVENLSFRIVLMGLKPKQQQRRNSNDYVYKHVSQMEPTRILL